MLNNKKPIVDPITGEINLNFTYKPTDEDYFIPTSSHDESTPNLDTISVGSDLEYIFNKYLQTVKEGKPSIRMANQLKLILDAIQVHHTFVESLSLTHDVNTMTRKTFIVPVGNISESKSFIQKLKEKIKFK